MPSTPPPDIRGAEEGLRPRNAALGSDARSLELDLPSFEDSEIEGLLEATDASFASSFLGEGAQIGPELAAQMRRAAGVADRLELEVLQESGADLDDLKRARLEGTRRPALVRIEDPACVELEPGRLQLSFALPKGSYATALLHELCGATAAPGEEDEG